MQLVQNVKIKPLGFIKKIMLYRTSFTDHIFSKLTMAHLQFLGYFSRKNYPL